MSINTQINRQFVALWASFALAIALGVMAPAFAYASDAEAPIDEIQQEAVVSNSLHAAAAEGTQPAAEGEAAANGAMDLAATSTANTDVSSASSATQSNGNAANSGTAEDASSLHAASDPVTLTAPATVAGSPAVVTDKQTTQETVTAETQDMYRMYNPNSGEHFYTADATERDHLVNVGWNYEGVGWTAPVTSDDPVYRLYNPNAGDHHYTLDASEKDYLSSIGWNYEGIGWYSASSAKGTPVFRQYNPNATAGSHNFTMDTSENTYLIEAGWSFETIAWYALAARSEVVEHTTSTVIATAPYLAATFATNDEKVLETVVSYGKDGVTYLLLPSYAPLSKLMLNAFNANNEQVSIFLSNKTGYTLVDPAVSIDFTSLGATTDSAGSLYLTFMTTSMDAVFQLVVMKSANVSTVYINSSNIASQGRAYIEGSEDHSTKAKVAVSVVNAGGSTIYSSDDLSNSKKLSTIKGRGNSSWENGEKKPYQISLSSKSELVDGAGKAKKWILLANSADPTLLGNTIAYDFAKELGLGSVDSTPVDLYYDGEYRGSYLLVEKIEIDKNRVNIVDLEDAYEEANPDIDLETQPTATATNRFDRTIQFVQDIVDPADYSGGYLLELDTAYYETEACWFEVEWPNTGIITHFVVKSPEFASYNAIVFISEAVQEALYSLASGRTNLTDGSYSFDLDSFAEMYLLSEFFKNLDVYASSTYYYLDAGSTVFMSGPVWDYDACMGRRIDSKGSTDCTYTGIFSAVTGMTIFTNGIQERVKEIYRTKFSSLVKDVLLGDSTAVGSAGMLHSIAWYADRITASQRMNELVFGITSFGNQMKPYKTWTENVQYLLNWVYWRTNWFNENYVNIGDNSVTNANRSYDGFDYGLVFDYDYYLDQNPDVAARYNNPEDVLLHFILYGMPQGRVGSRNFDVNVYRSKNPELNEQFGDNLTAYYYHYCTDGFKAGLISWS